MFHFEEQVTMTCVLMIYYIRFKCLNNQRQFENDFTTYHLTCQFMVNYAEQPLQMG